MRLFLLACAAPLVLLAGCSSTSSASDRAAADDAAAILAGRNVSPYGLFLAGQAALHQGRSADAAAYFERATTQNADNRLIAERAFTAAVLAGDIKKAAALAPADENASEGARRLGRLVVGVDALAEGKGRLAHETLTEDVGFPHKAAAALLAPWAAAQAGDLEGSLVSPRLAGDRLVEFFGQLGQAHLYERARRYDEAETAFMSLLSGDHPGEMLVLAYGGFLERRGRRADAVEVYDAALAQSPASPGLTQARARAAAGKAPPPAPTIRQGASQSMLAPAAAMLAARQHQLALAYLRLALRLDPQRDEAWVLLGDLMSAAGDDEAAREAYQKPKPGSPEYAGARAKLAWTYQNAGEPERAIEMARQAATDGDMASVVALADLLRVNERYAEAAEVMDGLIARTKTPDWRLLYARGVSYERMGQWEKAEQDLRAALELNPDEPELLNYLGYSWIDRGENLMEALALVEKAVAANPRSGAMIDSLGWAYYRLGQYDKAVEKLEEAVGLEAGDPEINSHLGDAYWQVGRRDEAQFQWRRVLTLDPSDKIKAEAEAKLASGLGADGPAPTPRVASQ